MDNSPGHESPDFTVDWPTPEHAQMTWIWDPSHFPDPLTPLSRDFTSRIMDAHNAILNLRPHEQMEMIFPHGFAFDKQTPEPDPSSDPVEEARRQHIESIVPRAWEHWTEEVRPQIQATCHELQDGSYSQMSLEEMCANIEEWMDRATHAYALTLAYIVEAMMRTWHQFTEFCTKVLGDEGEAMAVVMTQGFANPTSSSDVARWELARLADTLPMVEQAIRDRHEDDLLEALPQTVGGPVFLAAFRRFLGKYGWRALDWGELSLTTWREDPRLVLQLVRRDLGDTGGGPRVALRRSAARRRRMTNRARSLLSDQPEKLSKFNKLLEQSRQYVPLREDRAQWQLTCGGSFRVPCMALGQKLR